MIFLSWGSMAGLNVVDNSSAKVLIPKSELQMLYRRIKAIEAHVIRLEKENLRLHHLVLFKAENSSIKF